VNVLREYIQFFPTSALAIILKAYLESEISPFPPPEVEKGAEQEMLKTADARDPEETLPPDERISIMIACFYLIQLSQYGS